MTGYNIRMCEDTADIEVVVEVTIVFHRRRQKLQFCDGRDVADRDRLGADHRDGPRNVLQPRLATLGGDDHVM